MLVIEELRKPPPNWQEIVAAHEEATEQREEHQIPIMTSGSVVVGDGGGSGSQRGRAYKGRHCKKFYTEEGCPYGDACTFLHDEQSKARESVAISLSPTVGSGGYNPTTVTGGMVQKPSNWKTRICNKWEMTGYCPFGSKCHFAHGAAGESRVSYVPLIIIVCYTSCFIHIGSNVFSYDSTCAKTEYAHSLYLSSSL